MRLEGRGRDMVMTETKLVCSDNFCKAAKLAQIIALPWIIQNILYLSSIALLNKSIVARKAFFKVICSPNA